MRVAAKVLGSLLGAAAGAVLFALVAYGAGYVLIDWGIIRYDSFVDDDAALKNIGIGMAGGVLGLIAGAATGWRVASR